RRAARRGRFPGPRRGVRTPTVFPPATSPPRPCSALHGPARTHATGQPAPADPPPTGPTPPTAPHPHRRLGAPRRPKTGQDPPAPHPHRRLPVPRCPGRESDLPVSHRDFEVPVRG